MKIGKFGERNKMSIDTIRHYIDMGLIVPEKKGGQYVFDERCQEDLELIIEFKGMGFSLSEIKTILLFNHFGNLTEYEQNSYYQSLFSDKFTKIEEEIEQLTAMKENLRLKKELLASKSEAPEILTGVDLKHLELLRCVKCKGNLTLHEGSIHRNQIIQGSLICDCGEQYTIDSGIIIAGEPFKPIGPASVSPLVTDYIQGTDSAYLENLHKGLHWAKRKLAQFELQQKVLLELGSGVGFTLRNIYPSLPENCLYIAVDHNLERHRLLKSLIDRTGSGSKVLFICADFLNIPLMNHSIDLVIDHSGTSNYSFTHTNFLLDDVDVLLKKDSQLLGSYIVFENFSSKSLIEAKYRDGFKVDHIKKKLGALGFHLLEERKSGYAEKPGRYENFFVPGEKISGYSYWGKRWG
ncbi:MAG: MerR family transcriptional regulator [Bacillota bacterium]|nr:MerR family transcriptional regulator [Bacillota bacterium]